MPLNRIEWDTLRKLMQVQFGSLNEEIVQRFFNDIDRAILTESKDAKITLLCAIQKKAEQYSAETLAAVEQAQAKVNAELKANPNLIPTLNLPELVRTVMFQSRLVAFAQVAVVQFEEAREVFNSFFTDRKTFAAKYEPGSTHMLERPISVRKKPEGELH